MIPALALYQKFWTFSIVAPRCDFFGNQTGQLIRRCDLHKTFVRKTKQFLEGSLLNYTMHRKRDTQVSQQPNFQSMSFTSLWLDGFASFPQAPILAANKSLPFSKLQLQHCVSDTFFRSP